MNESKNASTTWTLYSDNSQAWNSMLADCAKAEKSIDLEQFIFMADDFGNRMIQICAERASKGVRVRFLWDAAGSFTLLGPNIISDLAQKGITLVFWKTLVPSYYKVPNFRSWYLRNHRRTLVIDGKVAYTGSICVHDSLKNWRDTNVRLEGPIVRSMQSAFDRMWFRALKKKILPRRVFSNEKRFQYVTNSPTPGRHHINTHVKEAIKNANKFVYITTPYFVPTHGILHEIKRAAKRGLDVRLLIPEAANHVSLDSGARSFFTSLLEAGVRIFLYEGNLIHGKCIVVDGDWSTVGSLNLDNVSLLYNYEANIISTDQDFASELIGHFTHDLEKSKEVTLTKWKSRFFIEKIPEVLIKLVRKFL